jgi:F-type H+-transporting ATPase subunit gamma
MSQVREIIKHRNAVGNIHTVTKTMELIASSRFRQCRQHVQQARRYTQQLIATAAALAARNDLSGLQHPLATVKDPEAPVLLIVLSSNRGLCGAYNNTLLAMAARRWEQLVEAGPARLCTVGRRGSEYFRRRGIKPDADYDQFDSIPKRWAVERFIASETAHFCAGGYSAVEVAYTEFISSSHQHPAVARLLPLVTPSESGETSAAADDAFEIHLSPSLMFDQLLSTLLDARAWEIFIESLASEHAQRNQAMQQATSSANDMMKDLTRQANRLRQSRITTELIEVVSGRGSMGEGPG